MDFYGTTYMPTETSTTGLGTIIWTVIAIVTAIAGTVVLFVLFLNKKNCNKFKGFTGWLYDFLNFKSFFIDYILRFSYIFLAIFITLESFALIGTSFVSFILLLIFGNIALRLAYELSMMFISLCSNVSEINKKMKDLNKKEN